MESTVEIREKIRAALRGDPSLMISAKSLDMESDDLIEILSVVPPFALRADACVLSDLATHQMGRRRGDRNIRRPPRCSDSAWMGDRCLSWAAAYVEMAARLACDASSIRESFGVDFPLVSVEHSGGDEHGNGRAVMILGFNHGRRLVYKPRGRPLLWALEAAIMQIETSCGPTGLRLPQTLIRNDYAWSQFVDNHRAESTSQTAGAYRGLGALAALAWALGGRDLHHENVAFARDGVYLLDEECFLSPVLPAADGLPQEARATLAFFQESVAYCGILPMRPVVDGSTQGDCSSLHALRQDAEPGGEDAQSWQQTFLEAFDEVLDATISAWPALQAILSLAQDNHAVSRVVVRSTQLYSDLLDLHFSDLPPEQISALMHSRLAASSAFEPWRTNVIPHEVAVLMSGDTPMFTAPIGEQALILDTVRYEIGAVSGLAAARSRTTGNGPGMAAKWEARASLGIAESDDGPTSGRSPITSPADSTPTPTLGDMRSAATRLAQALALIAFPGRSGGFTWPDITYSQPRKWHVSDAGTSISDGSAGVMLALSLAELLETHAGRQPDSAVHALTEQLWAEWACRVRQRDQYKIGTISLRWLVDDLAIATAAPHMQRDVPSSASQAIIDRCSHVAAHAQDSSDKVKSLLPLVAKAFSVFTQGHEVAGMTEADGGTTRVEAADLRRTDSAEQLATDLTPAAEEGAGTSHPFDFIEAVRSADRPTRDQRSLSPLLSASSLLQLPVSRWGLRHGVAGKAALYTVRYGSAAPLSVFGEAPHYLATSDPQQIALNLPRPGLTAGAAGLLYELARSSLPQPIPPALLLVAP